MKEKIPSGAKLPVKLTIHERDIILDETFCDPGLMKLATVDGKQVIFEWSLDEIEDIQGFIAAEANHTKNTKLEKELDRLSDKLQVFLDKYDDQDE